MAIEHFQPKSHDGSNDYWNLYVTLQSANQRKRKKERRYVGHPLMNERFFQEAGGFESRIDYVREEFFYAERDPDDDLAVALLDYLDINSPERVEARRRHASRLRDLFDIAGYGPEEVTRYFADHPEETDYPTVLREELGVDVLG